MKKFLTLAVFVLLIAMCGLVMYFIFSFVNSKESIDLGVVSTQAEYDKFIERTDSKVLAYEKAPEKLQKQSPSIIFTKPKDYDMSFSNSEISSRINYSTWSTMPVSNVQVKFSDDNKIEVSGNLVSSNVEEFASVVNYFGYSEDNVVKGLNYLSKMGDNPSFYIDATASVSDNQLDLTASEVKINGLSLPASPATDALIMATESIMSQVSGLDAKKITISDNALNFEGNSPSIVYVDQN